MFTPQLKRRIVKKVRDGMVRFYRGPRLEAACLYWAGYTAACLSRRYQLRAIIQAGTTEWPCVKHDDGVSITHFGYVYEADSNMTRVMLASDLMPEMHVWAAIPSRNEIIDLTTRYLVDQAKHRANITWSAPAPPDFIWSPADELPPGVIYRPDPSATLWALRKLAASVRQPHV